MKAVFIKSFLKIQSLYPVAEQRYAPAAKYLRFDLGAAAELRSNYLKRNTYREFFFLDPGRRRTAQECSGGSESRHLDGRQMLENIL